ncbi:hypothetical protein LEP1GSC036_4371 [Leptospira weilii str. 2006001853]|uniref:Uncharacterized protein n=3 Tax=Leptospira weilii TaxID=28184 RepID=A0A828YY64_9LEPT|nr:hypothetical protein LEP1GSC036_4371 [Leptospira weilii str. 2006001853]EMJ66094.1 hypothetical protein LEP1GSC051_1071 [Leptospira sp. P2653]EMM72360.1 hypothetical protein LEP1GSC038_3916 [Leptospira weilii str. 2006001855]EMN46498.1 hypothetical protein LEP1GSC086_3143 [Leptospira weilii str. LNT 1234]EMN91122.1 hypothetical protein LEP1GSC108_1061 [Leptospira weilii str. UI 13098]
MFSAFHRIAHEFRMRNKLITWPQKSFFLFGIKVFYLFGLF